MLPTFLHIGVAKGASSFLYRNAREHPEVFVPPANDNVNFFQNRHHKGLDWYERQFFADYAGERAVGEFSNGYLVSEPALRRVAEALPRVQLTVTLRDPVQRAYLDWGHMHYKQKFGLNPNQAGKHIPLEKVFHPNGWAFARWWLEYGLYGHHLERLYALFPRERVRVMLYEDLCDDPDALLEGFFRFIGVDQTFRASMSREDVNPDRGDPDCRNVLSRELREEMRAFFRPDVEKLEALLHRDLSAWKAE